jgi:hypothetical protein
VIAVLRSLQNDVRCGEARNGVAHVSVGRGGEYALKKQAGEVIGCHETQV